MTLASLPRTAACLVCAIGLVVPVTAAPAEFVFVPDPARDGAAMLSGATWIGVGPGFTLRLQQIDEGQRLAFIEKSTGMKTDPFAAPPGKAPRFLTFILQLENNGAGSLVFRSQQCWLVTNKKEFLNPIGMETLRGTYGVMGREMSPAYEGVGSAFVPTSRTLGPGESMSGLLVYSMFNPKTRRYQVDIQVTTPSGDVVTVTAAYKRVKKPVETKE